MISKVFRWLAAALVVAVPATAAAQKKAPSGYVLTHEHPAVGMAFGGNYAFTGKPGNYIQGIMEDGYTAECGGCKLGQPCDHGHVNGNITASWLVGKPMGRDMGDHASHMGPRQDAFSHLRYSTQWTRDAWKPPQRRFAKDRMRIMVAYAVESEMMCEQLY